MRFGSLLFAVLMGVVATGVGMCPAFGAEPDAARAVPWDWSGVMGTGQSLSVGARADKTPSTQPAPGHLQLSTGDLPWPIDPNDPVLQLVPLTEPIGRRAPNYPSSWPENITGETWHGAMATQLSALVKEATGRDFVSVQGAFGEDGQGMVFLKKNAEPRGLNGRSYQAAMIWANAVDRLAAEAGKSFGVGALVVTHGETDCGNPNYQQELYKLWQDYNADVTAITGQSQPIQMIVSQQNSLWHTSTVAQWKIGVEHPETIVCSGPKYQYPYVSDAVHLTNEGYEQLGEKYAQIYFHRVILGEPWQPLQPTKVERDGKVITVTYHVPVGPMVWESSWEAPYASTPEWKEGRGFEVTSADGAKVTIESTEIQGDSVIITCATDPGPGARVGYATIGEDKVVMQTPFPGTRHWGLLRDSDPFTGAMTGQPQPNYGVAFEMTAP